MKTDKQAELSKFSSDNPFLTYTLWLDLGDQLACKVGYTSSFFNRLSQLSAGMPKEICQYTLISAPDAETAHQREIYIQSAMKPFKSRNEWFCSEHGQLLAGLWCCALGVVWTVSLAVGDSIGVHRVVTDWDYYGKRPNPKGEMIQTVTRAWKVPFKAKEWDEMEIRFGYAMPEPEETIERAIELPDFGGK